MNVPRDGWSKPLTVMNRVKQASVALLSALWLLGSGFSLPGSCGNTVAQVPQPAVSQASQPADHRTASRAGKFGRTADWEIRDTAGWETCATVAVSGCAPSTSRHALEAGKDCASRHSPGSEAAVKVVHSRFVKQSGKGSIGPCDINCCLLSFKPPASTHLSPRIPDPGISWQFFFRTALDPRAPSMVS